MKYIIFIVIFLFYNPIKCTPVPIGYVGFDDLVSDSLYNLVEKYVTKYDKVFSLPSVTSHNAADQSLEKVNETLKAWVDQKVKNVFFYLPEIKSDDLQALADYYDIYVFNAINTEELNCLSKTVYGYDLCYDKGQTVHRYIMRFQHNIIISKPSDCVNGLVKFLTQFGHNRTLSLVQDTIDDDALDRHFDFLKTKINVSQSVIIYNFVQDMAIIEKITTLFEATFKVKSIIMNFGVERKEVIGMDPSLHKSNSFASEIYTIDDSSEIYEILDPTLPSPLPVLSSVEILMYEMIDIVRQKYEDNPTLTTLQLQSELFEKNLECSGGLKFSMFTNNRLVGDMQIVQMIKNATTSQTELTVIDLIDIWYQLPPGQIIGQPMAVTCNVINDPVIYKQAALYIGVSVYGDNERGVLERHNLASFLAAVDAVNDGYTIMDRPLVPIIIDAALNNEDFEKEMETYKEFDIFLFYSNSDMEDIDSFIYPMNILYINAYYSSGEYCNKNLLNGNIATSSMLNRAVHTLFKSFQDVFIVYTETMYSQNSLSSMQYYAKEQGINVIDTYMMDKPDFIIGTNVCSVIENKCQDGCLIINLCDTTYQEPFFKAYKDRNTLSPDKQPVVTFTVDERLIESIGAEYFAGHYVFAYYFNTINDNNSKKMKETLADVYNDENVIVTNNMAIAYSQPFLIRNGLNVVYDSSYDILKSAIAYASYDGPGGKLQYNSESYATGTIKLGKIDENGVINIINTQNYLEQTNSYSDMSAICNWDIGKKEIRDIYKIIFLFIRTDDYEIYDQYYSQYFSLMISLVNTNYGGINNHILVGRQPYLATLDDLIEYVKNNANDSSIIAFFGTTANIEREKIHPYLIENKKLLFSVLPTEGEQSLSHVIQFGRIPTLYVSKMYGYFYKEAPKCSIVYYERLPEKAFIAEHFWRYGQQFEVVQCSKYPVNTTQDIINFATHLNETAENGTVIFTLLLNDHIQLLQTMYDYEYYSDKYPVVLLDGLVESVLHAANTTLYKGHYFLTQFSALDESYTSFYEFVENQLGNKNEVVTEVSMNIYSALLYLRTAIEALNNYDAVTLRDELYRTTITAIGGSDSISSKNIASGRTYLCKCDGNGFFEIVIQPSTNYDIFPLSPLFSKDGLQYEIDFSVSDELKLASVYPIGFYCEPEDEGLFFLVDVYEKLLNSKGGNNGIPFEVHKISCGNTEGIDDFITKRQSKIGITNCNATLQKNHEELFKQLKSMSFSVTKDEYGVCNSAIVSMGTSPILRVVPLVQYLVSNYNTVYVFAVSKRFSESVEYTLLKNTLSVYSNLFVGEIIIDEDKDDKSVSISRIYDLISAIHVATPTGGVIFNYLEDVDYHKAVYESLYKHMMSKFNNINFVEKYVIVSESLELFLQVPDHLRYGHLCQIQAYASPDTSVSAYNVGVSVYGKEYDLTETESTILVTLELLGESITQIKNHEDYLDLLHRQSFKTSYGSISIGTDNYGNVPMYLVTSNKDGDIHLKDTLYRELDAESFRKEYNLVESYDVCYITGDYNGYDEYNSTLKEKIPTPIVLLVPLSGDYSFVGLNLVLSYYVAIDYLNTQKDSIFYYSPIIINCGLGDEYVINQLKDLKQKYKTFITFGTYDSNLHRDAREIIESEDILLFYPPDYQGQECMRNVIYTGIPIGEKTALLSYINSHFSDIIYIIYTATAMNLDITKHLELEAVELGMTIKRMIEMPLVDYKISDIIDVIKIDLPTGGVILSLIDGSAGIDFMQSVYTHDITSPDYVIINYYLRLADMENKMVYMNGQYYWLSHYKIAQQFRDTSNELYEIHNNKYTRYSKNEMLPSAVMSVFILDQALRNTGQTSINNVTLDMLLDNIHNIELENFDGIKVGNNNHITYSYALYRIVENNGNFISELKYSYDSVNTANPWSTLVDKNIDFNYYICDWSNNNDDVKHEKVKVDSLLAALIVDVTGVFRDVSVTSVDNLLSEIAYTNKVQNGIIGYKVVYKIYDSKSNADGALAAAKLAVKDDPDVVIGCYTNACRTIIQPYFASLTPPKVIWFPAPFEAQECKENVFYTGMISNQFMEVISNYLTRQSTKAKSLGLIGHKGSWSNLVFTIAKSKIDKNVYNISTYEVEDILYMASTVATMIAAMPLGGSIITTYDSDALMALLSDLDTNIFEKDKYEVLTMLVDRDLIEADTVSEKFDTLVVSTHFDETGGKESRLYKLTNTYTGREFNTAFGESSALAYRFWEAGLLKANKKIKDLELNPYLYNQRAESCSGDVILKNNHYTSLHLAIGKWNSDHSVTVKYSQTQSIDPMAWNWDLPESNQLVCDYENYDNKTEAEKHLVNALNVLLAISQSGANKDIDDGLLTVINVCINQINNQNGLLDKQLYLTTVDIGLTETQCYDSIENALKEKEFEVIFATASATCAEMFVSYISTNNIPWFQIGYVGGESCNEYLYYSSREPSTIDRIVDTYARPNDEKKMTFVLIGSKDEYSVNAIDYASKYLDFKKITVDSSTTVDNTYTDFTSFVSSVKNRNPNGCTILFFGSVTNHIYLDKALEANGMDIYTYTIISYSTGEDMLKKGVRSFYSAQSYFSSIDSEENRIFKEAISGYSLTDYTELMSSTYSIFHMWANAVNSTQSTVSDVIMKTLHNMEYNSPEGVIKMNTNHYLSHFLLIAAKNADDSGFTIVYKSNTAITPTPWKKFVNDGIYKCDFSDESIGYKQKDMTTTIGILNSYTGKYSDTERAMTDGIIEAVNELNGAGGVLQRIIQMEVRNPESEDSKYIQMANELGKLDEVIAVFGVGRYAIQKQVAPVLDKYTTPFFYPGNTAAEFCDKYTFSFQSTTSQITKALEKYVLENYKNYILIQDSNNSYSTISVESIKTSIEYIHLTISGIYNSSDLDELNKVTDTQFSNSLTIIATGVDSFVNIMTYFCYRKLTANKIPMLVTTLDGRVLRKLDENCVNGLYFLSTFVEDMGISTSDRSTYIESAATFVDKMYNSFGKDSILTAAMEAGYTAVKLWADVVENTYTFDESQIRTRLYGYSYASPTGNIEVNTNGYTNRVIYYGRIGSKYTASIIDYSSKGEEGVAYDQYLPGNDGLTCDFTISSEDHGMLKNENIKLVFLHDKNNYEKEIPIMLEEMNAVKEINYNQINDYNVKAMFIFGSDADDFDNQLLKFQNDSDVMGFIGCSSVICRESALKAAENSHKIFINLGVTEGNYCSENIVNVGRTAYQSVKIGIDYCITQSLNTFYFLGDDQDDISKSYYKYAYNYIKELFSTNLKSNFIEDKTITSSTVNTVFEKVNNAKGDETSIVVLYALKGERSIAFLNLVKSLDLISRSIDILFITYDHYEYSSFDLSPFEGSLVVLSFSSALTSDVCQSFISDINENIGTNRYVSESIESVKIAMDLWKEAMTKGYTDSGNRKPTLEYMLINMIDVDSSAPSGSFTLESSNYALRSVYIFEIAEDGSRNQVHPYKGGATIDISPHPFYSDNVPGKCKFGKQDVFYDYDTAIYAIYYVLFGVAMICSLFSLVFTIKNRNLKVIRCFGRAYSFVLSFCLICITLSAVPISLYPSSENIVCMSRPAFLGAFYKITMGVLLAKSTKIYSKSRRRNNIVVSKTRVTIRRILGFVLPLLLIELAEIILWGLLDPNEYQAVSSQKYSTYFTNSYIRECTISTPFSVIEIGIDGIIALSFLYISYAGRNISNEFNDSLGLFLTGIIVTILGAVLVALDFNINNEPDSVLLFRGIGIQIHVIIISLLQYGLKLVNLYLNEDAARVTSSGSAANASKGIPLSGNTSSHGYSQSLLKSSTLTMTHTRAFNTHGIFTNTTQTQQTVKTQGTQPNPH